MSTPPCPTAPGQGKDRCARRDAPRQGPVRRQDGSPSPGQFSTCTPHFARLEDAPCRCTHSIETQLLQNICSGDLILIRAKSDILLLYVQSGRIQRVAGWPEIPAGAYSLVVDRSEERR